MRVLVFGMNDNPGGIESFLTNYIRRLQGDDMQLKDRSFRAAA